MIDQQQSFLKAGKNCFYSLGNFESIFDVFLHKDHFYEVNPIGSFAKIGKLFNKSVELLDSMPNGEYRVYNYVFTFNEKTFKFEFQHVMYFMIKDQNKRAYLLADISYITPYSYDFNIAETEKMGTPKIRFQKID